MISIRFLWLNTSSRTQKRIDYLRKEAQMLKKSKGNLNDSLTELQKQKDEVASLKNTFKVRRTSLENVSMLRVDIIEKIRRVSGKESPTP